MLCPVCKVEMVIQELQQVEVDHCHHCLGIWLDQGELEMLCGSDEAGNTLLSSRRYAKTTEMARECPICRTAMLKRHVGDDLNLILLDECPKHHGIWFDAGELQHLIGSSPANTSQKLLNLLRDMFRG